MGVYKPTYNWGVPHCTKARVQRLHFHLPCGWKAHHTSLPEVSPGAPGDGRHGAIAKEDLAKERVWFRFKGVFEDHLEKTPKKMEFET